MCYSLAGIICILVKRMSKIVRVSENYNDQLMIGVKAVILKKGSESALIGLPLESSLGWYDSCYSTEYSCWWIGNEYLETVGTITRSKFK